jgi:FMN hydrolase / 5-amino-6-(5-phospho-D-ribitylamino)uracil phosphatase
MNVSCITFDLDDTLWETGPVIARAEALAHDWLIEHAPQAVAGRTHDELLEHRRGHYATRPDLSHDFTALRQSWLADIVAGAGYEAAVAEAAFEVFWRARNEVTPFPAALDLLSNLRGRYVLGTITNGNADVHHIGLGTHFEFTVTAADAGAMKPSAQIFAYALDQAGIAPQDALHVGDDAHADIHGAKQAGMRAVWVNPSSKSWDPALGEPADAVVRDVSELAALLR